MNSMILRQWHGYVGVFIAPSILFFALTGALQLFDLHEAHGRYEPAPIIERLGQMHKNQVFTLRRHPPPPPAIGGASVIQPARKSPPGDDDARLSTVLLKWFFLLISSGLVVSTVLGLWVGLTHNRRKRTSWCLLVAGAIIPIALLLI